MLWYWRLIILCDPYIQAKTIAEFLVRADLVKEFNRLQVRGIIQIVLEDDKRSKKDD